MALFKAKNQENDLVGDILQRAGVAWWSLKLEGSVFDHSENLRMWLKPGTQELKLNDYLEALGEQDRSRLTAKLQAQAVNHEPFSVEHELKTAAGGKRYVRMQVQLLRNAAGKPERISGVVNDIHFESEERRLLGLVREATEVMDSGVLLLGSNHTPIWANPAFTSLLGYTVVEFSGLNPFDLLQGPSLTEEVRASIKADLDEGGNLHRELKLLNKYGEPTWLQVDARPQTDHEGTLIGYAVVFKDINELKAQQQEIEEQKQDILDSIRHARRIQAALLPDPDLVARTLPKHFLHYLPRDIVSGDFYYLFPLAEGFLFAVVDCTGHGVPGAFMSALGHTNLNEVIRQLEMEGHVRPDPAEILARLDRRIRYFLGQDAEGANVNDGMDVCLVRLDPKPNGGYAGAFAGANRPLYQATGGEVVIHETTKLPIGGKSEEAKVFQTRTFDLAPGEWIYLFTDGFPDQFGGPNHRKFGTKQLRELLVEINALPVAAQYQRLSEAYDNWKGQTPQIDDVLLVGIGG